MPLSPVQYLDRYHSVFICDARLAMLGYANITKYISGEPASGVSERGALMRSVAKALTGSSSGTVKNLFSVPAGHGFDPGEEFCTAAVRRAYAGRGSPHEMIDAVRLAVAFGRVTHPVSSSEYAQKWFGSDCNAFVGNWLGISPSVAIFAYFLGYGSGSIPGATASVYASRDWLPLKPVGSVAEIRQGNVVVTYGLPRGNKRHKHIALVERCTPAGGGRHMLELAEWGVAGGKDDHHNTLNVKFQSSWRHPQRKGTPLLAFEDTDKEGATHRFLLDHSSLNALPYRGWEVCGQWGV
jgi:hypothetical protein